MPGDISFPDLGNLVWEVGQDWWIGQVELLPGRVIDLMVCHESEDRSEEDTLARAQRVFLGLRQREAEYRRWSAEQLEGDNWTDPPLTADQIYGLLTIATLCVNDDGTADIYWDDQEELFWGHNVVTRLGKKGECLEADME